MSDHKVHVSRLKAGCAKCVQVKFSARMLDPGETLVLDAHVKADTRAGREIEITVQTSERHQPVARSVLRYAVVPVLTLDPVKIDLGSCEPGATLEARVKVTANVPVEMESFVLEPFVTEGLPATLDVSPLQRTAMTKLVDRVEAEVTLRLELPPRLRGDFEELLVFPEGDHGVAQVSIRGRVSEGGSILRTRRIFVGPVAAGEVERKRVQLRYLVPRDPVLHEVKVLDIDGLAVEAAVLPDQDLFDLQITYSPREAGQYQGTLQLFTDLQEAPLEVIVGARAQ